MALVVKEKRSDESKDCDEKCNDQRDFCTKRKRLRFRCSSEILVLLVETSVDSHLMRVGVVVVVLSACPGFHPGFQFRFSRRILHFFSPAFRMDRRPVPADQISLYTLHLL